MYGIRFDYTGFFFRGTAFLLGKFNGEPFRCYAKSGGQNLWLPFKDSEGIKIFHPKGFSGTLDKAMKHYEAQSILAKEGLAPTPIEMYEVDLNFIKVVAVLPVWTCYGIMMKRVLSGGVPQILRSLELFGVQNNPQTQAVIDDLVRWSGPDALTLADYMILCRFFGVPEKERLNEIMDGIKSRLPPVFSKSPDLLSWPNVVLDECGEAKVVDCDLSGI